MWKLMLAVLLISPQCVKNFSDNFNKIYQQILANFSEQLINKTRSLLPGASISHIIPLSQPCPVSFYF